VVNKMTIDQIEQIAGRTAEFEPPATAVDLIRCRMKLAKMKLPEIPKAYADFLRQCNGFSDGGDQAFYGTDQIVSANDNEKAFFRAKKKILLGIGGEDLYVYNAKTGHYEVWDETCFDVYKEYETFEDMFRYVNKRR